MAIRAVRVPPANSSDKETIKRMRAELCSANILVGLLAALVDHYLIAYEETRDLLAQRERELAEDRRRNGSKPTAVLMRSGESRGSYPTRALG
jgi:hypothetical protein